MMKRIWYGILSMIIALNIFCIPVSATEAENMLSMEDASLNIFFRCITTQGTAPFLMGEVSGIALEEGEFLIATEVAVSLDGENYTDLSFERAGDWVMGGKGFSRMILVPTDPLLLQYFNNEFDAIYISMTLSKCDEDGKLIGNDTKTLSDCWMRPVEDGNCTSTGNRMIVHGYPNKITSGMMFRKIVQMQVTGTNGSYTLPSKIPVILGFCAVDSNPDWLVEIQYPIVWEKIPDDSQQMIYQAETISTPTIETDKFEFYYKDTWYQVDGSEESPFPVVTTYDFPFQRINCIVNLVEPGYISPITLTSEQVDGTGPVGIELPYKPSDASKIEVQVSTDGGTTWKYAADVDLNKYPIDAIPKFPEYSANILTSEQVQTYSAEGNGGFQVRLKIYGGPLGNKNVDESTGFTYTETETANYPSDYAYTPPEDPSGDHGAGGNKGNVGTDNSGSTDGVRPGTEIDSDDISESESESDFEPESEPESEPETEAINESKMDIISKETINPEPVKESVSMQESQKDSETEEPATPSTERKQEGTFAAERKSDESVTHEKIIVVSLGITTVFAVFLSFIRRFRR